MVEKVLLWIRGYVLCYIKGYSVERFINLCCAKEILLRQVNHSEQGYEFYITLKEYRMLRPIARKSKTIPYIKKKYGLPFLLHRYRKRKGLFIGVLLFIVLLYVMSLFIWDISIVGGYKHTKEALLEFVNEKQVYSGMMKSNVDCQKIEEQIRLRYSDISWVSAEVKGTRLIIKFTETNMPSPKQKTMEPASIVATKSAVVQKIITRNGTPKVKIGDVIQKGDVLVSGLVDVMGDFGILIRQKEVVADADIICKSFYEYNESFPIEYMKKVYTGKEKKHYSFQLLNKKISLYSPRISYKSYDIITDESILKLSWNFYLPISTKVTTYQEYNSVKQVYTDDEATTIARKRLKEYLDVLVENGVEIIENNVDIKIENGKCTASGKIIVLESCWNYKQIDDNEWRDNNSDELSGDNH